VTPHRRSRQHLALWRKRRRADFRRILLLAFVTLFLIPLMAIPAVAASTVGPLPTVDGLSSSGMEQDTLIYDRNGGLLADIGKQGDHRIVVPLSYISAWLVKATLATEDRTFYNNSGIDLGGIFRAAWADYTHHHINQGGSTISQQLVKQVFIGPNPAPTLQRKLREAILAIALNRRYTKNEILEMYLNTIYYGSQSYGVESAARSFFKSNAHNVTLAQAAMLAGLPQAPTQNSPVLNPETAKRRQAEVLQAMVDAKYISAAQATAAYAEKLDVSAPSTQVKAPYFVDYVIKTLRSQFHIDPVGDRKGYRVYTSLDMNLQTLAERIVADQIAQKGNYYNFHDGALVSMNPKTGEVLAMVGGDNYQRPGGYYNMAYDVPRQPGSSFKIITYTAAIESRRFNMLSPVLDEPLKFPVGGDGPGYLPGFAPYAPQNYDGHFHGTLPLKMVMGNSLNIPALKTELRTGIPAVVDMAGRLGISCLGLPCQDRTPDYYAMSLTLGGYEVRVTDMATVAATLANQGIRHRPSPILNIKDGLGHNVYTYDPTKNEFRAVSTQVAFIISSIMSDDRNRCLSFGCGGDLTLPGRHVAAKTGTTQSFKDNWTVGFTPTLATAVWVGNPNNIALNHNSTGIVGAAPIWHNFMKQALAGTPDQWYPVPPGLDQVGANFFLPGTERLQPVLAQPWPTCHFGSFNPYNLTYAQTIVDGVPCVLARPKPPPPQPQPAPSQQPCPPGWLQNGKCQPPINN
jgi:membrane peptidoglycan carboxypeptidase